MATYYALIYRPPNNDTVVPAAVIDAAYAAELQAQGDLLVDTTITYPPQPANHWEIWSASFGGPMPFVPDYGGANANALFRASAQRTIAAAGISTTSESIVVYTKATGDWFVIQYTANSPLVITGGDTQLYSYGGNTLYNGQPWELRIDFTTFGVNFTLPDQYFSISAMRVWGQKAVVIPEPDPNGFWANLINCREVGTGAGSGSGSGGGVAPGAGGGDSPETATAVTNLPYGATLGAIAADGAKWFNVTLSAGTYRFHTTDSPDPLAYNTVVLVGTSLEVPPVGVSDDVSGGDLRSDLTITLGTGDYFVAVFSGAYEAPVPAGTIFKIEAA